jgi:phosphopantetheinyl transferase (holo-ACP synthase)
MFSMVIKMIRNLLFHACPKDNEMLYFNIRYLSKYFHLFNGKKVFNVAYGKDMMSLDDFKSILEKHNINTEQIIFTTSKNTNSLRERPAFFKNLLPKVKSLNENEITFFCHTKGVSYKSFQVPKTWARLMYEYNLNDINKIERILNKYPCCGPCCGILKKGPSSWCGYHVPWHFSGTFFWFRNKSLFSKDWQHTRPGKHGVETYLSTHFSTKEAKCLKFNLKKEHLVPQNVTWSSFSILTRLKQKTIEFFIKP